MVSLERVYANYLCRKYVVVSKFSLDDAIAKFLNLTKQSISTCDNFIEIEELNKFCEETKALYYRPKFGFLGKIQIIKDFCQKHRMVFIEDFTENFSANKIIDGKSWYAGMFGDISVCVKDNVFFYATDDEKLVDFLCGVAIPIEDAMKKKLIDTLFEVEAEKRRRRIVVANYVALFAYTGLSHFLKPIDEDEGETASYPVFAVTLEKASELCQYLTQNDLQITSCNNLLSLPTDITEDELKDVIDLISKFYMEEF